MEPNTVGDDGFLTDRGATAAATAAESTAFLFLRPAARRLRTRHLRVHH